MQMWKTQKLNNSHLGMFFNKPICSMVLEYLPAFARTKSPCFVGKYTSTMEHMGMKSDHHNPVAGNHNIQPLYSSAPKYTSTMEHMGNHLLLVNIVPNSDVYMVSHMLHTMENHV